MKDEKLKEILRAWKDKYVAQDNNPQRTESVSLSSKLAKGGDSVSKIEMRHVPVPEDDNIFLYTGQQVVRRNRVPTCLALSIAMQTISLPNSNSVYMATNLKEDKVVMGFSIALMIIVLIVLYSLARTAGESDQLMN